jgi:hypothetical protein
LRPVAEREKEAQNKQPEIEVVEDEVKDVDLLERFGKNVIKNIRHFIYSKFAPRQVG